MTTSKTVKVAIFNVTEQGFYDDPSFVIIDIDEPLSRRIRQLQSALLALKCYQIDDGFESDSIRWLDEDENDIPNWRAEYGVDCMWLSVYESDFTLNVMPKHATECNRLYTTPINIDRLEPAY